jgi:hypothetical protein
VVSNLRSGPRISERKLDDLRAPKNGFDSQF